MTSLLIDSWFARQVTARLAHAYFYGRGLASRNITLDRDPCYNTNGFFDIAGWGRVPLVTYSYFTASPVVPDLITGGAINAMNSHNAHY